MSDAKLDAISTWLVAGAPPPRAFDDLIAEYATRLRNAGYPIASIAFYSKNIHPMFPAKEVLWSEKRGVRQQTFAHAHLAGTGYRSTPFAFAIEQTRLHRYRLSSDTPDNEPDVLGVYRKAGFSDLLILPLFDVDGRVTSCIGYGTKQSGGFSESDVRNLRRLQAPLARVCQHYSDKSDIAVSLQTYLGRGIGEKILNGHIQRGEGETIPAILLFVDVVGFTALSNLLPAEDVVRLLNQFFEIISESVKSRNGEILKFLGDGALIIFPVPDDLTAQETVAREALDAVDAARAQLESVDEPNAADFRASLHIGDVFYGNIGSVDRLDFTAIGPAVNLSSRMVDEAANLNAKTVCSAAFFEISGLAEAASAELTLRGFDDQIPVYVLD